MAFSVEKLTNEPVIVAQFESQVNPREIVDAYLKILEFALMHPGPVSYVIDIQRVSSSPAHLISGFKDLVRAVAGAAVDPQLTFAFVGQGDLQADFTSQNISFFDTLSEAKAFVNAKHPIALTA